MPDKRKRLIGRIAVAAVFALLVAAIAFLCTKEIPSNPINSAGTAFASPTMYVSPEGQEGKSDGSDSNNNNEQQQNNPKQADQKLNDLLDKLDSSTGSNGGGTGTSGGGSSSGSSNNNSNQGSGQNDAPTGAGISTNLGEFEALSTKTRSPNPYGFSPSTRSGFDQDNNKLWFYAAPNSMTPEGFSVKVEYSSALTGNSFTDADVADNNMYSLDVQKVDGDITNVRLTLLTQSGTATNLVVNYKIEYNGRKSPTIDVNLTQNQVITTNYYDLRVAAKDCDGATIYNDNIEVYLDGERQQSASGGDVVEYSIDVSKNMTGDNTEHTVEVKATDYSTEKASATVAYTIIYQHVPYGAEIGTVHMTIDATTVGLNVVDTFDVTLHKGYPFAYDMMQVLDSRGYGVECSGPSDKGDPESSGWNNYYLSRLSGSAFSGQNIPERLKNKIEDDKINYDWSSYSDNSLGEMDYTSISGWIYILNGSSSSKTLGSFNPVDGDNLTLIFEIAGGKEVGYPSASSGALSTYNAIWFAGKETLEYNLVVLQVVEEATCKVTGRARYVDKVEYDYDNDNGTDTISKYGSFSDQEGGPVNGQYITLPTTEHTWENDWANSVEPTETEDGIKAFRCKVCGETKEEVWPKTGGGES